jgi:hypothetical protein
MALSDEALQLWNKAEALLEERVFQPATLAVRKRVAPGCPPTEAAAVDSPIGFFTDLQ